MKKQIITIISLVILFLIGIVSSIPLIPHVFYGEVYYSDGNLIQENLIVTAKINNSEVGNSEIVNGEYDLVVAFETGETVYFYIEEIKEPIENYTFQELGLTELNLTTNLTNPNSSNESNESSENNDSSSSSSSTSSKSSGGGGGGGFSESSTEDIINLNYETGSLGGIGFIKTNESSEKTSSGITGSVINFISSGKVAITFISLIGILILFLIIKKYKR